MKQSIRLSLLSLLLLVLIPLSAQAAPLKNISWRAEYYDNASLSGQPKLTRYEDSINQDWGLCSPAPEIPCDYFSARWTITRHFEKGTYLFLLTVDDGARVWLDGQLVIDAWNIGHKDKFKTRVYVETAGDHEVQVAYFENTGKALINLEWILLGGEDDIIGAWVGEYYNNRDLEGTPVLVRQDGAVNFDWNSGSPSPKVPRDNFSVRWTRSVYLEAGSYLFRIQHDDGMRIYVDGKTIYDSWYDQSITYTTRKVHLYGGYRTFVVEYYEHLDNAVAFVSIDGDPGDYGDYDPDPGAGIIVDNTGAGFEWGGPASSRYINPGGYGSNYYWTFSSSAAVVNSAKWRPGLGEAGNYEIYAYIPGDNASTTAARYRLFHHGEWVDRVVNQSQYSGEWVSLGSYYFDGGGQEYVRLDDNTGEGGGSAKIAFDAVKFVKR